ncbi:hypothetical protein HMPREF9104_01427 [Lentilactobacillus kisonensis F0435]|uniref:Uncharacterized protein n=1 Tax=Lentilactobacillus kisonensis F0435 TaxID=797516 RepID=H1LFQ1_9LACO|nr:hypothetical protein HMPREF9104_01427 [Lentilactobacillus kisonensis F0435]
MDKTIIDNSLYVKIARQENKNNLLHELLLENRLVLREYSIADISD